MNWIVLQDFGKCRTSIQRIMMYFHFLNSNLSLSFLLLLLMCSKSASAVHDPIIRSFYYSCIQDVIFRPLTFAEWRMHFAIFGIFTSNKEYRSFLTPLTSGVPFLRMGVD